MKNIVVAIPFLILVWGCKAQKKEFSLLGKWEQTERLGNNGAKDFSVPVKNGSIITFEVGNVITDKSGEKGTYEVKGDSLHIQFPDRAYFYRFFPDKKNGEKIYLTPVTPEYQIICDEGCADVYEKIDD